MQPISWITQAESKRFARILPEFRLLSPRRLRKSEAAIRKENYIVERNLRKTRTGKVVSDKMDKTIVVAVEDHVKHPLYKKDRKENL